VRCFAAVRQLRGRLVYPNEKLVVLNVGTKYSDTVPVDVPMPTKGALIPMTDLAVFTI
jgi:hypothetical protein